MYELETHYLKVGQGDCTLIIVRENEDPDFSTSYDERIIKVVVYDCGSSSGKRAGSAFLAACESLRIKTIDIMVVSHFDTDHYNGFNWLFQQKGKNARTVDRLFEKAEVYTQGCIHRTTTTKGAKHKPDEEYLSTHDVISGHNTSKNASGPQYDALRDYISFLENLQALNLRNGSSIKYKTERVISGYPNPGEAVVPGTRYVEERRWWPVHPGQDKKSKYDGFVKVNFEDSAYLLGTNLLGSDFTNDTGVELRCIAYNGHVHNGPFRFQPLKGDKNSKIANNRSIGCVLKFHDYTAWFGGDLEDEMERECLEPIKQMHAKGLTVLKASHHGSKNSTKKSFLEKTKPNIVIISCGESGAKVEDTNREKGKHGHPNVETVERLISYFEKNNGLGVYTTWCPRTEQYLAAGVPMLDGENDRFVITKSNISLRLTSDQADTGGTGKPAYRVRANRTTKEMTIRRSGKVLSRRRDVEKYVLENRRRFKKRSKPGDEFSFELFMRETKKDKDILVMIRGNGKRQREVSVKGDMEEVTHKFKKRARTSNYPTRSEKE